MARNTMGNVQSAFVLQSLSSVCVVHSTPSQPTWNKWTDTSTDINSDKMGPIWSICRRWSAAPHMEKKEREKKWKLFLRKYIYISTLKCREIIGSVCYCVTASVVCGEAHHLHQEWNTLRWPHPIQLSWALEESPSDFFLAIQNNTVVRCYQPWQEKEIFFF